jgi:D-alanyl-D-alanine carboxypeptidase/D-alanyl-D-alanine-endopeptidase (penicillin-binding protein 4)
VRGSLARILALVAALVALAAPAASAAGPEATRRALAREMARAGAASGALVVDLGSGAEVYSARPDGRRMPASVQKLFVSTAALRRLGAQARFSTDALAAAAPDPLGVVQGDLYLRGGGDPYLSSLDIGRLADAVTAAGVTRVTGRVLGDESGFDLLRGVPSSLFRLTAETGPLSALAVNHGRTGRSAPYWQATPARFAARTFAAALRKRGVAVRAGGDAGVTPATAVPVADWPSFPLGELLRLQNQPSDNFMAEMLLKNLGARFGGAGSTAGGAAVVQAELAKLGAAPRIVDGSGLSRRDRTSPREVVALLAAMRPEPAFTASLAVAGRSGTLSTRMRGTAAQDRCRAKTGTLRDVSALAGYCDTSTGAHVAFAFLMNRVAPWWARIRQDRMTAVLARYSG